MKKTIEINLPYIETEKLKSMLTNLCRYGFAEDDSKPKVKAFSKILEQFPNAITRDNPLYEVFIGYYLQALDKRVAASTCHLGAYARNGMIITFESEHQEAEPLDTELASILKAALDGMGIEHCEKNETENDEWGFTPLSEDKIKELEDILDKNMEVQESCCSLVGYTSYSKNTLQVDPFESSWEGLGIFVEWQAEDEAEAEKVAKDVSGEISEALGIEVKFSASRDIWGVETDKELWYVHLDTLLEMPSAA